jgi:hypothetical protein
VLVDSVSRNQNYYGPLPPKSSYSYWEAIANDQSREQVKNAGPFPQVPLIVLTAVKHHGAPERIEPLWQKWQLELTKLSPEGMQIIAWGSDHYIQKDQPRLVVDAIATVIKSANLDK